MKLTNAMEPMVKAQIALFRDSGEGENLCWCPLCRADMMALALSSLPPRYQTRRRPSIANDPTHLGTVETEVLNAMRHVGRYPKHSLGSAVPAGEPVWVVNFPLEEGFRAVDRFLQAPGESCDCWTCRCDAVAFALNRYPARYGVEYQGRTHLPDDERARMGTELSAILELALTVATTIPRH